MKKTYDKARWLPIIITGAILLSIFYVINNFTDVKAMLVRFVNVMSPLLLGLLLTYFLYVPHHFIEKQLLKIKRKRLKFFSKHARGISTGVVFILMFVIIALILAYVLPILFSSIADLVNNIPGYYQELIASLDNLLRGTPFEDLNITDVLWENSGTIVNSLINSTGLEQAARGVFNIAGGLLNVILGLFLALYLLLYRDEIVAYFSRLSDALFKNAKSRERVSRYMGQVNNVLLTYIASKGVDSMTNFTAATIIVSISGMPYALLLGLLAGILNFIPYIGSIISATIISILALLTCNLPTAIGVAIAMFVFQQLDGNFIEPKIMKTSLKMNPIIVIMAVVIFGEYFGLPGMFLGVPVTAIIIQLIDEFIASRQEEDLVSDDYLDRR